MAVCRPVSSALPLIGRRQRTGGILLKSKEAVGRIIEGLKALYPDAQCSLDYEKDYELLFSTRLAAQCTDARVNLITPVLFARYPTLEALAEADEAEVSGIIHSCGFFRTKARDIVLASQMLLHDYDGRVPDEMEELLRLPGVGRKTANLILGDIYGKPAVVADTHCIRIAGRLGLTNGTKDPYKTELQLKDALPPEEQNDFCHRLVLHGRSVCLARRPRCEICPIAADCAFMAGGEEGSDDETD
jgi:endonuclease-3